MSKQERLFYKQKMLATSQRDMAWKRIESIEDRLKQMVENDNSLDPLIQISINIVLGEIKWRRAKIVFFES